MDVENTFTIYDIKALIKDKEGIPTKQQRLLFMDNQLEDGYTFSDYDIPKESELILLLGTKGGVKGGVKIAKKYHIKQSTTNITKVGRCLVEMEKDGTNLVKNVRKEVLDFAKDKADDKLPKKIKMSDPTQLFRITKSLAPNSHSHKIRAISEVVFNKQFELIEKMEAEIKLCKEAMVTTTQHHYDMVFMNSEVSITVIIINIIMINSIACSIYLLVK